MIYVAILARAQAPGRRDVIPKGNLLFVVIARISARAFPIRPLFEARTKALACEISREYIIRDSASIAAIAGEKDTFSREKLLSNAITICYAAVRLRGLTTIGTMRCVYAAACACVHRWCGGRKIERRKESGRSIDIDQLAGIGPRMRELIKPNH